MSDHQWSGAPGIYCTVCGNEPPLESALVCDQCESDDEGLLTKLCPMHQQWSEAIEGCPPDAALVRAFNEAYPR